MQQQQTLCKDDVWDITNAVPGTSLAKFDASIVGFIWVFSSARTWVGLSRQWNLRMFLTWMSY